MEDKFKNLKTFASKNPQIAVSGCKVSEAMRNISEQLYKAEQNFMFQKMKEELGISDEETILSTFLETGSILSILDESAFEAPQQDISSLKKRIKYCKNPMEKKKLERELNALYKAQKRRK